MNHKKEVVESFDDIELYKKAMQEEGEKNKKLGIPSSFMQNGEIYYELPDGTITKEKPWE